MITLDINSTQVKILETDGESITSWASHAIEADVFDDGMIADTNALGNIIKELISSSGIKGNRVTASINGLFSLSRIIVVPTPPEIPVSEEAVKDAVENILPVSPDEMYLSWHSIGAGEGGHQVITHTIPKESIDDQMLALKTAGLTSRLLDLRTTAIARAVNCEDGIILNIDEETYDIVLMVDGLAEVMRTTAWTQEDLTLEEKAELLVTALDTTVGFFGDKRPSLPFRKTNPLYITGDMSVNLDLVKMIRERTEFTEVAFEPALEYPDYFPASQYAVNIGLALKGKTTEDEEFRRNMTPDINLLPKKYRPWKPTPRQTYLSLAVIIAIALLIPVYQMATAAMDETKDLEIKHNALNSLMELRKTEIAKRDPLKQLVDEYQIITGMGSGFLEDYETIKELTEDYSVQISSISHLGDEISFTCTAENYQVFRQFLTALEESGRFLTPIVPPEGYPYIKSGSIKLECNPDV